MIGQHSEMRFQYEWAGTQLINTRVLVHPDEIDTPQRQLGTIVLPPDPEPIPNARPENYTIDETNPVSTMLNGTATAATTVLVVLSTAGFTTGNFAVVQLDNGGLPRVTITVSNATTLTIVPSIPTQASSGNLVSYVVN